MAGRPSGRPGLRAVLSVYFGRPSGRPEAPTVGFSTVGGRPGGQPTGLTEPQRLVFGSLYIWGFGHCFGLRFLVDFEPVFPIPLKEFSPLNRELIFPI